MARPVGVDKLSRLGQEFVGVGPEVVALCLGKRSEVSRVAEAKPPRGARRVRGTPPSSPG